MSATDVAALQTAVNALSKTGSLLSAGKLDEAKTTARRATHGPAHAAAAGALPALLRLWPALTRVTLLPRAAARGWRR